MSATGMTIQAHQLTKRYGPTLAVDGLTFQVQPGRVTGFLGPNGAGKSTTSPPPSIPDAAPTRTCWRWRRPTPFPAAGWTKSSAWSALTGSRAGRRGPSRWA